MPRFGHLFDIHTSHAASKQRAFPAWDIPEISCFFVGHMLRSDNYFYTNFFVLLCYFGTAHFNCNAEKG